jgi:class 3 adenylate cyclase/tetratricopeptide (TPR) repeat protein
MGLTHHSMLTGVQRYRATPRGAGFGRKAPHVDPPPLESAYRRGSRWGARVICPACGGVTPDDKRFCADCGAPLSAACSTCGAELIAGKKFCADCGSPVGGVAAAVPAQPALPVAERRVCSVLFADLVGFTPLSESRDAESVRELLSGYFDVARTLIARYGGTVEKFIGDAVMAVWGVPTAHEDDAERCVRAAMELVDAVGAYGEANRASGLAARAGVVTGEVAVTLGAAGQGMVAGDAVNTAARVQAAAEPGTVLVDATTRAASARGIGFADAGPHELKGKAAPVALWRATRVVGAIGGSERVDGLEARFVGRDRELRAIKEEYHGCVDARRARLVSVLGVAGVGKSRLRWEFFKYIDGLADLVAWHAGRCLSYGEGVAYWALAEMVRQRLGIAEDEPTESAARKLDQGLIRWISSEADREFLSPRLGVLIGVSEAVLAREDLFAGWRLFFERLAEQEPVLLVVEDLHWADPGLLDFLEHLLDWSAEYPIFLITFARPELLDRRPTWATGRRNVTSLVLDPLTEPAMRHLLDDLVPGLPAAVADRIVAQADGVPLYAVETIRSLVDRDVVRPVEGVYRLLGEVDSLDVPASLASLIAARIDALQPDERALVQKLAVLGATFPRAAVAGLGGLSERDTDRLLADLVRKEVLAVRTDRLSPDRGQYTFARSMLRQVAYETLSRRERKSSHLAVAAHLRNTFPDDGAEVAEVVAQHYLDAYRAVPDDPDAEQVRAEAAAAFERAGQRALSLGAGETAMGAFRTAGELVVDERDRCRLVEQAGEAALLAGRTDEAISLFDSAEEGHRSAGRDREAARVTGRVGYALGRADRDDEAIDRLTAALAVLSEGPPDAALPNVHLSLATSLMFTGRRHEATPHVEAALELGAGLGLPGVLAEAAERKATLFTFSDRRDEGLAYFEWAATLADRHGLTRQSMMARLNAGALCMTTDRAQQWHDYAVAGIEAARRRGDRHGEAYAAGTLAAYYLYTGRWDEAEEHARSAPTSIGAQVSYVAVKACRGQLADAAGTLAWLAAFAGSADLQNRASCAASQAIAAAATGRWADALSVSLDALPAAVEGLGLHEFVRYIYPVALEAALQLGRFEDADRLLGILTGRLPGFRTPFLQSQTARYQARLLAARGAADGVAEGFAEAERILADLGYPYWSALAQLDHAGWLADTGRAADGEPLLAAAEEAFSRLGAAPSLHILAGLKVARSGVG